MAPYAPQSSTEGGGRSELRSTLVVLLGALALLSFPPSYQDGIAAAIRSTLLRPFLAIQEGLVSARNRAVEADVLQARIDSLTAVMVAGTTLEEENRRLRGLLDLSGRLGPEWQAVQILRPGTPDSESMLIVERGETAGIRGRAPLITREGLVGVVRTVSRDQAVGMDWSHPDFRASAMTVDGLQYGLVRSSRGLFAGETRLLLDGLPYHTALDSGTVVVTSGLGGVFPRGIPIGRVLETCSTPPPGGGAATTLEPFVEPGAIILVLVGTEGPGLADEGGADSTTAAGGEGVGPAAAWPPGGRLREEERVRLDSAVGGVLGSAVGGVSASDSVSPAAPGGTR
jgi:rod shape-determining protein MreC